MVLCDNCANLHFIKIDMEMVEALPHHFYFLDILIQKLTADLNVEKC